ncbi:amino acid adenylation domain-containing protein [Streptomyces sp. DSM 41527]|uniref:PhsB n=2 Tax=Streptomyces TaxID=1883 RepID=A0A0M3WR71_STRHY|nr:amino acid adenylation domain-containing protein [Streptomyces sp. DSM 41527]AKN91114.1 PhsB [Streptomyces hygroscopicus]MDT0457030.1 amino acid adenylation domain-containing protein [Streptomyces sp. DSM 41527]
MTLPEADTVTAQIAAIWAGLLDHPEIGPDDNVFRLGASSVMAVRAAARIREALNIPLPLRDVFESPSAAALAERVRAALSDPPTLTSPGAAPADGEETHDDPATAPLTFQQEPMWLFDQLQPGGATYHIHFAARFEGPLDLGVLDQCVRDLIERHTVLRTVFPTVGGRPCQRVLEHVRVPVEVSDLRELPQPVRQAQAARIATRDARAPFDLAAGPLLRVRVLHLTETRHRLLVTLPHIITDAWSDDILVRELNHLYRARSRGAAPALPPLPVTYQDWARRQRSEPARTEADQLDRWRRYLTGAPTVLELPADRPRPAVKRHRGRRLAFDIPESVARRLELLACDEGTTLYSVLLAGFGALLHRLTGQQEFLVGSPVANRTRTDTEGLVGLFVNTVAVRCTLTGRPSFLELVRRTRTSAAECFAHQELPFHRLVEHLAPVRSAAHTPLVQVMLALQNTPDRDGSNGDRGPFLREDDAADTGTAMFDLTLFLTRSGSGLRGEWEYDSDLFDEDRIGDLGRQLATLLDAALDRPDLPVALLPLQDRQERDRVVHAWNDTAAVDLPGGPDADTLPALVDAQARRTPDAVAVRTDDGTKLTYSQLVRAGERLARSLLDRGLAPEDVVAVACERSVEMVVALLGVLKAGGAYLPIDPEDPSERTRYVLHDSGTRFMLTLGRHAPGLPDMPGTTVVHLDDLQLFDDAEDDTPPLPTLAPGHLAYLIYTSGSTGRPKGVLNEHGPVCNRIRWGMAAFPLGPGGTVLQKTPIHFDISVWEIFWTLASGATLVLARPGGHRDPAYLARLLADEGVTDVHFVPSMLAVFLDGGPLLDGLRLRRVFCSGEALPAALRDQLFARLPLVELHNLYGPTEAAIEVTHWRCSPGESAVPIGRPIAGARCYVLDAELQPVPPGVPGELWLGGLPVARGYHGRPDLTGERFLPDPYGPAGSRMYRSGDLARWRRDGVLEYLGREDGQVKLHGQRIELSEIEAALAGHAGEADVVVDVRGTDALGKRLVAYVRPVRPEQAAELVDKIRALAAARLPAYMRPSTYVSLERLPLTASGKTDRKALPDPGPGEGSTTRTGTPPRSPVERELALLWSELLGVDGVGVEDNFFEIGGHSLLAARMTSRAGAALGLDLSVGLAFEHPTLGEFALAAVAARAAVDSAETQRLLAELEALAGAETGTGADDPVVTGTAGEAGDAENGLRGSR